MNDIEIIKQLEKEAGVKLEYLDVESCADFYSYYIGYVIDAKGSVTELRLDHQVTNFSTHLLSELKQLRILGLFETHKEDYSFLREIKGVVIEPAPQRSIFSITNVP